MDELAFGVHRLGVRRAHGRPTRRTRLNVGVCRATEWTCSPCGSVSMSIDRTLSAGVQRQGSQRRVAQHAAETLVALGVAVNGEGAADAAVDQIAVGEAHVRLETGDPGALEAAAQRRNVARQVDGHAYHGLAGEGLQVGFRKTQAGRHALGCRAVSGAQEEVRPHAVVDDQAGLARLEHAVEVYLGDAGADAVGRGEDEPAHARTIPTKFAGRWRWRESASANYSPGSPSAATRQGTPDGRHRPCSHCASFSSSRASTHTTARSSASGAASCRTAPCVTSPA